MKFILELEQLVVTLTECHLNYNRLLFPQHIWQHTATIRINNYRKNSYITQHINTFS